MEGVGERVVLLARSLPSGALFFPSGYYNTHSRADAALSPGLSAAMKHVSC